MKIVLLALLLLSKVTDVVKGVVEISPSVVAPVCQTGEQLELTCSLTGRFLRWEYTVRLENGGPMTFMPTITSGGTSGVPPPITVNSTTFSFLRLSTQPLTSTMTVSAVSDGLNGVQVNCIDAETSESTSTTIRLVNIGGVSQISNFSIQSRSSQFTSDRVSVILEWTISLSQIYYQNLLQNISILVVPDNHVTVNTGNRTLQLILVYNTLYNVSITQPGICGQPNQTAFIELNYSKCRNPMAIVNNNVRIAGYEDPALEGEVITLTCLPGQMLNGTGTLTCMRNGEWEPDPGEVNCISLPASMTTGHGGAATLTTCISSPYVLQLSDSVRTVEIRESGFDDIHLCCSGLLIIRGDATACVENGEWELETNQRNEGMHMSDATLITALISMISVLVVISVLTFIIGFICGQYYLRKKSAAANKNAKSSNTGPASEHAEDLELNENVAYVTLHPK